MNSPRHSFADVVACVVCLLVPVGISAGPAPEAPAAEPKSHTLFMGVDVAIERDKAFYPVRDVSGGAFLITVKGEPVFVPTNLKSVNLKIDQSLKLTTKHATVSHLKGDRAYTPENDPNRRFLAQVGNASAADASVSMAAGRIVQVEFAASAAAASPEGVSAEQRQDVEKAYRDLGAAIYSQGSDLNNAGNYALRLQEELAKELFDAMEVSFEVSSPVPLNNPYLMVITQFREQDAREGMIRNWIYAKSLPPITEEPQKVYVLQGGFPPGFKLVGYRVHLYNQGQEIATNISPKRVELTRDEALEYVILEHLAAHKGATLPPTPLTTELGADLRARLSTGQLGQTSYARVSADGRVLEAFADEACTAPVEDAEVAAVLRSMRFKPALEKGKPVEGVAPVVLGKLTF